MDDLGAKTVTEDPGSEFLDDAEQEKVKEFLIRNRKSKLGCSLEIDIKATYFEFHITLARIVFMVPLNRWLTNRFHVFIQ